MPCERTWPGCNFIGQGADQPRPVAAPVVLKDGLIRVQEFRVRMTRGRRRIILAPLRGHPVELYGPAEWQWFPTVVEFLPRTGHTDQPARVAEQGASVARIAD